MNVQQKVYPGINKNFIEKHFTQEEKSIIKKLSIDFYFTNGGGIIDLGMTSNYKYCLIKPTDKYKNLFNIEKEIIIIFSDYSNFESRTLDAVDAVENNIQQFRIEKICSVVISRDCNIENRIQELVRSEPECQIIIPFYYGEFENKYGDYYIRNRFKKYFYSRDLFAFNSPLKKDLYFFGRNDLVHKLVSRHKSNENSGLFGLRKTGKTSIVFGIQRNMKRIDGLSVFIDCQNPGFHKKRWNEALHYIIEEIKNQNKIKFTLRNIDKYTEVNASEYFERDLIKIIKKAHFNSILIIFDEIEHITPTVSLNNHWNSGNDFILFWQTLRSIYQKINGLFTYLIVGTNPKSIEISTINGIDNPIYNQVPYEYIEPFSVVDTRTMVRKLSRIMGLKFDEEIYSKLTEDYGGHPFLIRSVCSIIAKIVSAERPARIDKIIYDKGKKKFNYEYSNYFEMIISILKEFYPDEYEMLKFLSLGDLLSFQEFQELDLSYTNHLLGYNIIDSNNGNYFFKIEAINSYIKNKNKYKRLSLTDKEKISEISERRNNIEKKLRQIVRRTLFANFGENDAKKIVLEIMGTDRKRKYYSKRLKDIFDSNLSIIFFEDVRKLIITNWSIFEHLFGKEKNEFDIFMKTVNKYRIDAHAKSITDDELSYVRVCFNKLEDYITDYE